MDIKERALQAYAEQQEQRLQAREEAEGEMERRERRWLDETFGNPNLIEELATLGITARVTSDEGWHYLQVHIICPDCQREKWGGYIRDWAGLGEAIADPQKSLWGFHCCDGESEPRPICPLLSLAGGPEAPYHKCKLSGCAWWNGLGCGIAALHPV